MIIEDDSQVVEIVSRQLESLGFQFVHERDGQSGLQRALNDDFALVILDLGLPKLGGTEVCRRLRNEKEAIPILILTSESSETSTVLNLELGADEYITKPIKPLEFSARVRALLRRASTPDEASAQSRNDEKVLHFKDLRIDLNLRQVHCGDSLLDLTVTEFDLFLLFLNNKNRILSRDEIVTGIWSYSNYSNEQNVRTAVSRLRLKLESIGTQKPYIITKRGFGYGLAPEQ